MSTKLNELQATYDAARKDLLDALLERAGELGLAVRGGLTKLHFADNGDAPGHCRPWFTAYSDGMEVSQASREIVAEALATENLVPRIVALIDMDDDQVEYAIPAGLAAR